MRSSALSPLKIATLLPKSVPRLTALRRTRPAASTIATRGPAGRNNSTLVGTSNAAASCLIGRAGLYVCACEQGVLRIGHPYLDLHGASSGIDRARRAGDRPLDIPGRHAPAAHGDRIAHLDLPRINLRNINIQTQRIDLRDGEQCLTRAAIACIDQVADIDAAARHHAVERRNHLVEVLQVAQSRGVRLGRGEIRLRLL